MQPDKFIPLSKKIVKIAFNDFKIPALLKIGRTKWNFIFFFAAAHSKLQNL